MIPTCLPEKNNHISSSISKRDATQNNLSNHIYFDSVTMQKVNVPFLNIAPKKSWIMLHNKASYEELKRAEFEICKLNTKNCLINLLKPLIAIYEFEGSK